VNKSDCIQCIAMSRVSEVMGPKECSEIPRLEGRDAEKVLLSVVSGEVEHCLECGFAQT
jgi:hypothetical protein